MSRICRELAQIPESSRALPLLLMFSAILMGALCWVRLQTDLNFDGEIYILAARKYATGMFREGLAVYPMPLYPYLISLIHRLIPNWVLAGRLVSYFSMTLTVIPLYLLSRDLFNRRAAFWGCVAFTLLPETLLHSNSVLREPPFFLFYMWGVYFAQKTLQSKRFVHLSISVLFAWVSTFFRVEGLIVLPAYLSVLIFLIITQRGQRKLHCWFLLAWIGLFACLIAATLLSMGPRGEDISRYKDWVRFSAEIWNPTFLENYNRISSQLQQMQAASLNSDIGQHFAGVARKLIPLVYVFGTLHLFVKVILPVNVIPLVYGLVRARCNRGQIFLILLITFHLATICFMFIWRDLLIARYLFISVILAIPWVGLGIEKLLEFASARANGRLVAICFLSVLFIVPALKFDKYFINRDDLKSLAGKWIANNEGLKNLKIIFSDPGVAFHTEKEIAFHHDGDTIMLHQVPDDKHFSQIAQEALARKADVIVIYTRTERKNDIVDFEGYKEIKAFSDKNKLIKIYAAVNRLPSNENPGN